MLKVNSIDPDQLRQLEACVAESRKVIVRKMFEMDVAGNSGASDEPSPERARHLARKAAALMREIIAEESQFALLADSLPPADVLKPRRPTNRSTARGRQVIAAKLPVRGSVPAKNVSLAI
jgi:hypothetical protein